MDKKIDKNAFLHIVEVNEKADKEQSEFEFISFVSAVVITLILLTFVEDVYWLRIGVGVGVPIVVYFSLYWYFVSKIAAEKVAALEGYEQYLDEYHATIAKVEEMKKRFYDKKERYDADVLPGLPLAHFYPDLPRRADFGTKLYDQSISGSYDADSDSGCSGCGGD